MATRQAVQIPVYPWFKDHHFNGQTIFPAVESMLLLAGVARDIRPDMQITTMNEANFSKFLPIPAGARELSALVEINTDEESLDLKLLSKIQFKKISRIKVHAEISFPVRQQALEAVAQITATEEHFSIEADQIYRELVPFGPSYRSLTGTLYLSGNTAVGTLQAPTLSHQHRMEKEIGSPFPLDGAMHAACVLGQCIADFVPFPVGFASRCIHKPTRAGQRYNTTVLVQSATKDELLFDLSLFDNDGTACETVRGLRMRDISGGTIKPSQDLPRLRVSQQ